MWEGDDFSEDEEESGEEESDEEDGGESGEESLEEEEGDEGEGEADELEPSTVKINEDGGDKEESGSKELSEKEEDEEEVDDSSDDQINNKSYLPHRDKEDQKKSAHQFTVYQKSNVSPCRVLALLQCYMGDITLCIFSFCSLAFSDFNEASQLCTYVSNYQAVSRLKILKFARLLINR